MLSGLLGRPLFHAVRTGFAGVDIRAGALAMRGAGAGAGVAAAVCVLGVAYLSITIWQPLERRLLFWTMQAMVRLRSGMVWPHTLKASSMQSCCSCWVWAKAGVARRPAANTRASAIWFFMEMSPSISGTVL